MLGHPRDTRGTNEKQGKHLNIGGGGGRADAPEAIPDPVPQPEAEVTTKRERLLGAMGCDPSGLVGASGRIIGTPNDVLMASCRSDALGLARHERVVVIETATWTKARPGPPDRGRPSALGRKRPTTLKLWDQRDGSAEADQASKDPRQTSDRLE